MQPIGQAVLLSWSVPPAASLALALTAVVYLRGWILLRRAGLPYIPPWRAASFLLGLLSLWIALASPLDTFSSFVLTAHMTQHMVLMMIAPPLILLGSPLIPLVRGLPVFAAREFAGPFLNWRVSNRVGRALTQPIVALILMGAVMFAWHTPRLYELALSSGAWHEFEHACFFLTSLIFWWPVVQPWPSHAQWPRWAMVPYLLIADLQNTVLAAILIFSDRIIYPSYASVPRLFDFSALQDQAAAGAIMWAIGSIAFLVPAVGIAVRALSRRQTRAGSVGFQPREPSVLDRVVGASQRLSFGGNFLRRRLSGRGVEAISFLLLFAVTGLGLARLASAGSDDDDQTLRLRGQAGAFAIAVFAPPGGLESGTTNFSLLVQDRATQEVLTDAIVELKAALADGSRQMPVVRAATAESENKLLPSAEISFPAEGEWTLNVAVQRDAQHADFSMPLRVVKADAGISLHWPYIVLAGFAAILAFAYYRRHSAIAGAPRPAPKPAAERRPAKVR